MKTRSLLKGAGLAMLYLFPLFAIFLAPGQRGLYHQVMPITSLTRGALLDLLLLTLLLGAWFAWLSVMKSALLRRLLWLPAIFVTTLVAERGVAEFFRDINTAFQLPGWAASVPWFVLAIAVVLLLFARESYDSVTKAAEVFLMSAGIAALVVILPRLVYMCFNHAPPEQAFFSHSVSHPWSPGEPRVIWLLFDEFSYDQAFNHPQSGIDLPAFTALKRESVSFSQLAPAGILTQYVLPSLFMGEPVSDITSNHRGELLWRSNAQKPWRRFDPQMTVFGAARDQGWSTGVAGWYNPYCRFLATVLDRCYWTYQEFAGGSRFNRLSSERSAFENARDALPLVPQIENALDRTTSSLVHRSDYQRVLQQANLLVQDMNIRFVFVHLPVPHPPGIYPDPLNGGRADYLGNLVLADRTLAELRAAIAKTAASANTILIVSSDHSWRVQMWRSTADWTRAEQHASKGRFDPRPITLVHFPGQTQQNALSIDRPENALVIHKLLLGIFAGKIRTVGDLNDVLERKTSAAGSTT